MRFVNSWNGRTLMTAAEAIIRLETARRILGHDVTLDDGEVADLAIDREYDNEHDFADGSTTRSRGGFLAAYAIRLSAALDETRDPNFPDPVLPSVDVTGGVVSHTTCTGGTVLRVEIEQGARDASLGACVAVERPHEPFDPQSPRDIALWLLMGGDDLAVFGTEGPRRLSEVRIVEAICLLVATGDRRRCRMPLGDACQLAMRAGYPADPDTVLAVVRERAADLWLVERPWALDALKALDPDAAAVPAGHAAARDLIRQAERVAGRSGRRGGSILRPEPSPKPEPELADWELDLLSQ